MILYRFFLSGMAIVFCLLTSFSYAETLLPSHILQSAKQYFPEILEAREKLLAADAKILEAEGQFDASIESEIYSRTSGYYDGKQIDTRVVKPLPYYNSKVYGGYRASDGSFPIYEDKRVTNQKGEFLFGLELSLLRDRVIDEKRAKLSNQKIDKEIADIDYLMKQLTVQHDALYHYWRWVSIGKEVVVYQTLLDTANKRQSALEKRVQKGDLAAIFLKENKQNILKRQGNLQEVLRKFEIVSNHVSLYYRDNSGKMVDVKISQIPEVFPKASLTKDKQHAMAVIAMRPELQELGYQINKFENERALGENSVLPEANIGVEYAADQGSGSAIRAESESIVRLGVSIPLQTRAGKGRARHASSAIKQLQFKRQFLEEKLTNEIENSFVNLGTAESFVTLAKEEAILAKALEEAERKRFNNGQSDFFLLNLREEKTAEAKVKTIKSRADYYITLTHLHALTLDKEALGL
jgi:outer membrane protein TolC